MTSVACERVVVDAVEARQRGEGTLPGGVLLVETRNSRFLLVEGVCTNATDPRHMGSVLVGWLHDGLGPAYFQSEHELSVAPPRVSGRWRPGARAVFVPGKGTAVVTSPVLRLLVNGAQAPWDHATHDLGVLEADPVSADSIDQLPDEPTLQRPTLVDGPPERFSLAEACSFDDGQPERERERDDDEPTFRHARPLLADSSFASAASA